LNKFNRLWPGKMERGIEELCDERIAIGVVFHSKRSHTPFSL